MSLGHVTKYQPVAQYFEVGSHNSIPSPSPLRQSNVIIVALLWTNQHKHCVGGFEVEV